MALSLAHEAYNFICNVGGSISSTHLSSAISSYSKLHTVYGGNEHSRMESYDSMVNIYYDIATAFYEYAWGQSFHFATRFHGETFSESIKRHEHYIALQLGLKAKMKVLDVGCGIGGPLREIAKFSGASITGLNNNEHQIKRGIVLNKQHGLEHCCDFLKADFMKIPMPDNSYDAIYNIEACCHAPNLIENVLLQGVGKGRLLSFSGNQGDWWMSRALIIGKKNKLPFPHVKYRGERDHTRH